MPLIFYNHGLLVNPEHSNKDCFNPREI